RGGRKGGLGGIPPAEPVNEIGSDIFKYTPKKNLKLSKFRISVRNFWPTPRRRRRRKPSELF
ncbi:MAG: hypothetical protein COT41_00440, partial [Candidatus Portnoybacteria bacterium CG08_land_8_20_14_0_20_40_83]